PLRRSPETRGPNERSAALLPADAEASIRVGEVDHNTKSARNEPNHDGIRRQRAAAASRLSGSGRVHGTGSTWRSTIARLPSTPSSLNRNAIFVAWASRIASFVGRSQSWR